MKAGRVAQLSGFSRRRGSFENKLQKLVEGEVRVFKPRGIGSCPPVCGLRIAKVPLKH
jgi:hypothetical protein